jgi:PAS domain S-box-containing protein
MSSEKKLEAKTIETSTEERLPANLEQGMMLQDERGYIQAVNPTAANILGLTAEQLIGCTSIDPLWETIHENGSPFEGETHPAMVTLSTGKPCSNVVMGFYRSSGELVWLKLDSQPLFQDSQTKPYAVITTFSDITEQKQLQDDPTSNNLGDRFSVESSLQEQKSQFRAICETIPQQIWTALPNGCLDYVNPSRHQYSGVASEQLLDRHWADFLHGDDVQDALQIWEHAVREGTPYEIEARIIGAHGQARWFLIRVMPLRDERGKILKWYGINIDIDDYKRSSAVMSEAQVESERRRAELAKAYETLEQTLEELSITEEELRQQTLELEKERQRYQNLFDFAPDGYLVTDRNGKIEEANLTIAELLAIDQKYLIGQPLINFIPRQDYQAFHTHLEQLSALKQSQTWEITLEPRNKNSFPAEVTVVGIEDSSKQLVGWRWLIRNISDRKRAEVALRESEHRYRTVFETINDGFCVCEMLFDDKGEPTDYRFLEVNPLFEQMTGLDRATGKTARELVPNLEDFWVEIYGRVALTGEPVRFEDRSIPMNRWFEVKAFPVGEPQSHKFGILFTDITERKGAEKALRESEERFRILADSSPMLIWVNNLEGCEFVNRAYLEFLGVCEADVQQHDWSQFVHPDDRDAYLEDYLNAFARRDLFAAQFRFRRADGEYRWMKSQGVPRFSTIGDFLGYVGSAVDITDLKQAELEREQLLKREQASREEAEKANRVKDEFLAILSHELRSPLNPVLGWTQLLKTYKSDPERLEQGLDTIERNAKLLLELIDDLLDVAKILRGKIALNLAPVNLGKAIEGALETVSAAAKAKSITIETHLNSIAQVNGDLARLQQVFWNLLSNAVKFTNNGGKIEVSLDRVGDAAQITVSDNGKGIPPEFLPHVFEYFRQADGSITRKHGGLGLGLALVRHLVELHGGVVAVTSPGIDCGATFIVSLPLLKTSSDSNNCDCSNLELSSGQTDLTGVRILVVDDDPDNLEFLTMALQCYHASVVAVTSATEALSMLEEFAPNILVSDIAMPEMDGLTLIKSIRSRTPEKGGLIRAIALSAYAREIDRQRAIAAGFQIHISKPVNIDILVATILEILPN